MTDRLTEERKETNRAQREAEIIAVRRESAKVSLEALSRKIQEALEKPK